MPHTLVGLLILTFRSLPLRQMTSIAIALVLLAPMSLLAAAQGEKGNSQRLVRETHMSSSQEKLAEPGSAALSKATSKLPLRFEPNHGQTDPQVRFTSRVDGYNLFLTSSEMIMALNNPAGKQMESGDKAVAAEAGKANAGTVVRMKLEKANANPKIVALEELAGKTNYFIGSDHSKWRTNVPGYRKVKYQEVYPGVDMIYYSSRRQLEYDFIIAPGANPESISLSFKGARKLQVDTNGDIVLDTNNGTIRQGKPYVYQEVNGTRRSIACRYALHQEQVSFEIADYDVSKPLVIDPTVVYATYLGGGSDPPGGESGNDVATRVIVDSENNVYITGSTSSNFFPTTPGVYQTSDTGSSVFVTKLNAAGDTLIYSTYIGGTEIDGTSQGDGIANVSYGQGLAVDSAGNAYVTGYSSSDFPTTAGAFKRVHASADAFVTKLNSTGSALVYSTFLGGNSGDEWGYGIAVDSVGNAFVAGYTPSTNFPTTLGALQSSAASINSWEMDAFVTKLNATGSGLIYSTYLGGSSDDRAYDISVDSAGNAYVAGGALAGFPTTAGAFRTANSGGYDAFAAKINAAGSALIYATYIGGTGSDGGKSIAFDSNGNAYMTGSASAGFPTTAGAFQTTHGGDYDGYVTKLNATGSALVYSTLLGGSGEDLGNGIAVDNSGNAYVTGSTASANFPKTGDASQSSIGGGKDGFLAKLKANGSALISSTYMGGIGDDAGNGIAITSGGSAYVVGETISTNFPTTPGAYQPGHSVDNNYPSKDAFVVKFCVEAERAGALDASTTGPNAVTSTGYYKLAAALDPTVLDLAYAGEDLVPGDPATGRETELWAQIYRPSTLPTGPSPLIIFLHGNHGTCGSGSGPRVDNHSDYTFIGKCQGGDKIVNNHLGYAYLAERLASWGYIVVSINANRGITGEIPGPQSTTNYDPALIFARGRLVLRHLQKLSEWNQNGNTPRSAGVELKGKIDFRYVGLMGHSRGGEGVRAAYNLYGEPGSPWPARILSPVGFKGIFEIAPTDGGTFDVVNQVAVRRILNANGTAWNVMLPMCDGDVVDLWGVKPFDRMMISMASASENPATQKSTYTVWGANHNYYNTEWQVNESAGCIDHKALFLVPGTTGSSTQIGSANQRQTSLASLVGFFRANVGASANSSFNQNFDPRYNLPAVVTNVTRVDRGFTRSPNANVTTIFEDFDKQTGTNSYGFLNDVSGGVAVVHGTIPNHSDTTNNPVPDDLKAGVITWTSSGIDKYFQTNWKDVQTGTDINGYQTLDFRVSRQFDLARNSSAGTTFSIQIVMSDGSVSNPVELCKYANLTGPVGGLGNTGGRVGEYGGRHPILQTVRIPLTDFTNANLSQVRGVRFVFDGTAKGAIFLANIRLSK